MGEKLFPWKFQPHSFLSSALQDTLKNATVRFGEPRALATTYQAPHALHGND